MKISVTGVITAVLSIVFIGLAVVCVLLLSSKTAVEYDNNLVKDRNAITEEVDTLTTTLGTAKEPTDVQKEVEKLTTLNTNFKNKLQKENTPEDFKSLKTENEKFTQIVDRLIVKGGEYQASFTDQSADIQKIISEYNAIVAELDGQIEKIENKVKDAPKFNLP